MARVECEAVARPACLHSGPNKAPEPQLTTSGLRPEVSSKAVVEAWAKRPAAPVEILRDAVHKGPCRKEHVSPGDEVARAGKPLLLNIGPEVEGEDRLEGLRACPGRRGLVEH